MFYTVRDFCGLVLDPMSILFLSWSEVLIKIFQRLSTCIKSSPNFSFVFWHSRDQEYNLSYFYDVIYCLNKKRAQAPQLGQ